MKAVKILLAFATGLTFSHISLASSEEIQCRRDTTFIWGKGKDREIPGSYHHAYYFPDMVAVASDKPGVIKRYQGVEVFENKDLKWKLRVEFDRYTDYMEVNLEIIRIESNSEQIVGSNSYKLDLEDPVVQVELQNARVLKLAQDQKMKFWSYIYSGGQKFPDDIFFAAVKLGCYMELK